MRKKICLAAAVALVAAVSAPAHATGGGSDGPVHIGVIGTKLHVAEARALLDGHHPGARARLSLWKGDDWLKEVRGWKYSTARSKSGYDFEYVSWKINRSYPNNSRLCVEWQGWDYMACAKIHS
ncbi:hypothetical protein [Streptomyces griseosporeus]